MATAMAMAMASAASAVARFSSSATRSSGTGLLNLGLCRSARVAVQCRAQSGGADGGNVASRQRVAAAAEVAGQGWRSSIESLRDGETYSVVNNLKHLVLGSAEGEKLEIVATAIITGALALLLAFAAPCRAAGEPTDFSVYFGTAASASSYGGYGGNTNKRDSAEYTFEVPQGWKERTISKIEKGTNGTDSEFYNPKHKEEKVYVTYLAGFGRLAPRDNVLDNLALSDPVLQDILSLAEDIKAEDRKDTTGQLYYDYEIDSPVANALISVTCAKNKLYAHFVKAGPSDWNRDKAMLRHVHESFQTVGATPLAAPGEF